MTWIVESYAPIEEYKLNYRPTANSNGGNMYDSPHDSNQPQNFGHNAFSQVRIDYESIIAFYVNFYLNKK